MTHTENVVVLDFTSNEVDILELTFERNEDITIGEQVEDEIIKLGYNLDNIEYMSSEFEININRK